MVGVDAAVGVRIEGVMDAEALRHRVLPCVLAREPHGGGAHSMVAVAQANHIVASRVQSGHQESEVVRLRPGVYEIAHLRYYNRRNGFITTEWVYSPMCLCVYSPMGYSPMCLPHWVIPQHNPQWELGIPNGNWGFPKGMC